MAQTFAVLEAKPDVTAEELIETLRDYATSGAAIYFPTVWGIIDRVKPDEEQKKILAQLAQAGIEKQKKFEQVRAMRDYQMVLMRLANGLRT